MAKSHKAAPLVERVKGRPLQFQKLPPKPVRESFALRTKSWKQSLSPHKPAVKVKVAHA